MNYWKKKKFSVDKKKVCVVDIWQKGEEKIEFIRRILKLITEHSNGLEPKKVERGKPNGFFAVIS